MTDRHAAYIVVLSDDIREDEAELTLNALRMVKGVTGVTPVVADYDMVIARSRRDENWAHALRRLARKGPEGDSGDGC